MVANTSQMFDFADVSSISASSKVTETWANFFLPFQIEAKLLRHEGSCNRGRNIVVNIFKALCDNITGNKAITKRN